MFGGLKKKLQEAVKKVSKAVAEEKPVEERKEEIPLVKEEHSHLEEKLEIRHEISEMKKEAEDTLLDLEAPPKSYDYAAKEKHEEKYPLEELKEKEKEIVDKKKKLDIMLDGIQRIPSTSQRDEVPLQILEKESIKPKAEEHKKEKKSLLGGLIKKAVEKSLDEKDVEKIVKELHMTLLENDVALETADKISEDLKKELVGKSVPRTKIEDTIKNALRSAMLDVLSQEHIDIEKRIEGSENPLLIMFLGFNGTGKCVSGDTLISQSDGSAIPIADLYENVMKEKGEFPVEGGYIVNNPGMEVFSVNPYNLKTEKVKAQNIWKLKKDKLLRVHLSNGNDIKVTPEHPFFVLEPGNISQKRADEITCEDYVMVPRVLAPRVNSFKKLNLLNMISSRKLFVDSESLVASAYELMKNSFGSLEKAFYELSQESDWMTFRYFWKARNILPSTIILKLSKMDQGFAERVENEKFKVKFGRSQPISLPDPDQKFYEWLGLFYAEGHLDKNYVEFTNSEDWLLRMFTDLTKDIYGVNNAIIKPDLRNPNVKNSIIANRTLCYFVEKALGVPRYNKSSYMALPEWLMQCSDELIASFLRSYWEGDGHVQLKHKVLEATTASKKFARQHSLLLLRFGIIASFSKKTINKKHYYRIYINGKEKLTSFNENIGFLGTMKRQRLEALISMKSQFEKTELIPLQSEYLKNLRLSAGILQQDLANLLNIGPSLLCQYEQGLYQVSIPVNIISKLAVELSSPFLKTLANADVRWIKVKSVEEVIDSEEWVYDFTIPVYHNFVANNFIIHNTTNLAKLANRLRDYRPVLAAGDTFRAASIEQLEEHGRRLGMKVVKHTYGSDSAAVIFDAMKHAKAAGSRVVFADTAGRSHANVNLMDELKKICRVNKPDIKILVLDSLTGNDIYDQVRLFNDTVGIDAIILSKADVYDKGGAALSAAHTSGKPILFLGTGQDYGDLKEFNAEEIVRNLLE